jgi:Uma2 family endonuclease
MASLSEPSSEVDLDEVPVPDVSGLITEDDTPVDNVFSEKQMRLLTEPLHASWAAPGGRRLFLASNVGVFPTASNDPLVPDVFLATDTAPKQPFDEKRNRSFFVWEHGKPPDVVIEIVSNLEGGELTRKLRGYERMRVSHYVVFDPWRLLGNKPLTRFELHVDTLVEATGEIMFPRLGLGLSLWEGVYEQETAQWLRWCLPDGALVPTGFERAEAEKERAEAEKERAEAEKERADRLAAKLRELGVEVPE